MTDFVKFYGLTENPFAIEPDPKFFYPSESHREALSSLQYGITYRKGFILILGEAGIGKTMLMQHLMSTLDQPAKIIFFPQCLMPIEQMLQEMLNGLGFSSIPENKGVLIHQLYEHLMQCLRQDQNVVVILDEAENIHLDLLEEVRLLANLETGTSKLLQIVLVGQPALGKKLGSDIVRQIRQRIVINSAMAPLTQTESRKYIDHRIKVAGGNTSQIFTDPALQQICKQAEGIPLAINTLSANALLLGASLSEQKISSATVGKILHEKKSLSDEKVKKFVLRAKRRILRKMLFIVPALILLAAIAIFGTPYLQSFLTSLTASYEVVKPAARQKTGKVEVPPPLPADRLPSRPDAHAPKILPSPPEKPVLPSKDAVKTLPKISIKKMIEATSGINLYTLAHRHYGSTNETLVDHIMKVNPEIRNPHLIIIHQKIRIPEVAESLLIVPYSGTSYKVHLRTFADFKNANLYRTAASSYSKTVEIAPWKISPTETWYRVMAGPFADKAQAFDALEMMKQKGFSLMPSKTETSWKER